MLNHYYGRDDIVLGAYKGEFGKYCDGSWVPGEYIYDLVNNFDSPVWNSDQGPDSIEKQFCFSFG